MSENDESIVCPGEQVGLEVEVRAGKGCYARGGAVFASLVGSKQQQPAAAEDGDQRPVVQVVRRGEQRKVPLVGDVVTVKILRVMPRNATASILCIGTKALDRAFSGLIRVQDVRAQEIDKVQMYASFRPGDIVRAEVLSMGDARGSYFLSTAKNTLGVLHAKGPTGEPMVPLSWTQMQCPKTKAVEERKVACTS